MKRTITVCVIILTMILITTVSFAKDTIDVVIENRKIDFNKVQSDPIGRPYIENGRTYVPIRVITENLGYKVDWEQSTQTAIITKDKTRVEIKIGEITAKVNDEIWRIDADSKGNMGNTKAVIKNNRTYVPVRFIAEAMGERVEYREPRSSSVYNTTVYINSTDLPIQGDVEGYIFENENEEKTEEVNTEIKEREVIKRIGEIRSEWGKLKPSFTEVKYNEKPKVSGNYGLGELTGETLNNALNITNFIRKVAYLPSVTLDNEFNIEAQAASVINSANKELTHTPKKPYDMDESFYNMAYSGAGSSNIGAGYRSIIDSVIKGYMHDGDPSNISRVGHRLWILSPKLKKVGFGYAENYTAMKVIDRNKGETSYEPFEFVSWPSKVAMPVEYFNDDSYGFPWSVSLNPEKYDNKRLEEIEVELVRINDNKKWEFNNKRPERTERPTRDTKREERYSEQRDMEGYFNISTGNYGNLPYTIIFSPEGVGKYKHGDKFKVVIYNVYTLDGRLEDIRFETTFFNLNNGR